jgi:hypothetical protein
MLAHSIGLNIGITHRAGLGVPDACPPLTSLGDRIVFVRRGAGTDSIFTLAGGSTTPAYVPNSANFSGYVSWPRLSGGEVIAWGCYLPSNTYICRANPDGSSFDSLAPFTGSQPDWSPGDSLILMGWGNQLYTTNPDGSNLMARTPTLPLIYSPARGYAFSRDGATIAYPVTGSAARLIGLDGQNDVPVTSDLPRGDIIRWNPAGDSLAIAVGGRTGFWLVPVAGGPSLRVSSFPHYQESADVFDWGTEGLLFAHEQPGMDGIWLLPSGGGPLRRITAGRDVQPAFRRNP